MADDVVTATILASSAPVLVAPAMETGMWRNPLVQQHVGRLVELGRSRPSDPRTDCWPAGAPEKGG